MLLAHVIPFACHADRKPACSVRRASRKARKAARVEISPKRTITRRMADSLYDLVDRPTRERFEGRRQLG